MLRIVASRSSEQALKYYGEALSREDYYSGQQETAGRWYGDAARRLGLSGTVDKASFEALVQNLDPMTGKQLTARQNAERRVGYDFNFHCPKSVSLVHALTGDDAILEAFRSAVRDTMLDIQKDMETRVRKDRKQEDRATGNMACAEFIHRTARPVGGIPDPHLHAHCFVFNATYDKEEDRWKAGQFGNLKRDAPYYEALFHSRLSGQLAEMGYSIERGKRSWEIGGIPRSLVEKFSQRTAQIEEAARELGIQDDAAKDRLGATTRERKRHDLSMEQLTEEWNARLTVEERKALSQTKLSRGDNKVPLTSVKECFDYAEEHLFERGSVVSERRLLAEALWRGVGTVDSRDVHDHFDSRHYLRTKREGERLCTTTKVLLEEHEMVAMVRASRGINRAFKAEPHDFVQAGLSDEQKNAVRHILESVDGVTAIRGGAGTGKTTLMREAITALRGYGHTVHVFAPSAEASRGVLRGEGFHDAETVAKLLVDEDLQEQIRGGVIWIDEAGLLGTPTMKRVLDLAKEKGARVILSGDTRQHRSVERGDSLRLLQEQAGLACAELRTIHRQSGDYREAIQAISEGHIEAGFARLDRLGAIREMESHERYDELADDYVAAVKDGKSVLVVSPTHREAEWVTQSIRESMRRNEKLAPSTEERVVPRFKSLGWTEAEKTDAINYQPGHYVEFVRNAKGFTKSEKWMVAKVTEDEEVILRNRDGKEQTLPIHEADRFQVFEASELPLAAGDPIHFRQNGKARGGNRVHNGSVHELKGFDENGDLILANGWTVPADFGHLDHGYVLTSYSSQGKTVDHVLIAQGSQSWNAANREQFYVSASRGRQSVRIYTDNREDLLESVLGTSMRMSAMELEAEFREKRPEVQSVPLRERDRIVGQPEPTIPTPCRDSETIPQQEVGPPSSAPAETPLRSPRENGVPAPAETATTDANRPVPDHPGAPTSKPADSPPALKPPAPSREEPSKPKESPKGPSFGRTFRDKELLAKYTGRGVESGEGLGVRKEQIRHVLEKYAGRSFEADDQPTDERKRRDRDRSE